MGAYILFVWAIVATGLWIRSDYRAWSRIEVLTAALTFASNLHDSDCRLFLRLFLAGSEETLVRRFPSWPAYRDNALGIEGDDR